MNKLTAAITLFVGLYAFGRNNLYALDGVTFISNHNVLFKLLLPLAIASIGLCFFKGSKKIILIALSILTVDLLYRAYELIGFYSLPKLTTEIPYEAGTVVVTKLWPLYMLASLESLCVALIFWLLFTTNNA